MDTVAVVGHSVDSCALRTLGTFHAHRVQELWESLGPSWFHRTFCTVLERDRFADERAHLPGLGAVAVVVAAAPYGLSNDPSSAAKQPVRPRSLPSMRRRQPNCVPPKVGDCLTTTLATQGG